MELIFLNAFRANIHYNYSYVHSYEIHCSDRKLPPVQDLILLCYGAAK